MIYHKLSGIKIQKVEFSEENSKKIFIHDIINFMGEFADSERETNEAIENALENGFLIEAINEHHRLGLSVVTRSPFNYFQPKYHLAYIATAENVRGKGIGKKLLETVCELTNNSIALHVESDNNNAIEFYQKMGWENVYIRMMPDKNNSNNSDSS